MPGSGKTTFKSVAERLGFKIIRMGRVFINELCKEYNIQPTDAKSIREHMTLIRKERGEDVVAKYCLPYVNEDASNKIFIEGVRSLAETRYFQENLDGAKVVLVGLWSSTRTRRERLLKRIKEGRECGDQDIDKSLKDIKDRDVIELRSGVGHALAMSDYLIINEGSFEEFTLSCEELLKALSAKII